MPAQNDRLMIGERVWLAGTPVKVCRFSPTGDRVRFRLLDGSTVWRELWECAGLQRCTTLELLVWAGTEATK